jgi:hypothetical protein
MQSNLEEGCIFGLVNFKLLASCMKDIPERKR